MLFSDEKTDGIMNELFKLAGEDADILKQAMMCAAREIDVKDKDACVDPERIKFWINDIRFRPDLNEAENKNTITLEYGRGYSDCDDCGSYDWEDLSLYRNGELVKEFSYNGHMGGDTDLTSPELTLIAVLEALGFEVKVKNGSYGDKE